MGVEDLAGWCAFRYDGDWAVDGGGVHGTYRECAGRRGFNGIWGEDCALSGGKYFTGK